MMSDSISTCRICLQPIEPDRNICWVCFAELNPSDAPVDEQAKLPVDGEPGWSPKNRKKRSVQIPGPGRQSTAGTWLAVIGSSLLAGLLSGLATLFVVVIMIIAFVNSLFTALGEICSGPVP